MTDQAKKCWPVGLTEHLLEMQPMMKKLIQEYVPGWIRRRHSTTSILHRVLDEIPDQVSKVPKGRKVVDRYLEHHATLSEEEKQPLVEVFMITLTRAIERDRKQRTRHPETALPPGQDGVDKSPPGWATELQDTLDQVCKELSTDKHREVFLEDYVRRLLEWCYETEEPRGSHRPKKFKFPIAEVANKHSISTSRVRQIKSEIETRLRNHFSE
ncbi:MAG: hypothetical protein KDA84_21565 [Planctomycetaceae bacterium]|nr:hypothetical protein [Planctomycetaceae bacterium]